MSPTRFRECLSLVGWSGQGFARFVGRDERTVRRWAAGMVPIPPPIADWLERLAAFHASNPPPTP